MTWSQLECLEGFSALLLGGTLHEVAQSSTVAATMQHDEVEQEGQVVGPNASTQVAPFEEATGSLKSSELLLQGLFLGRDADNHLVPTWRISATLAHLLPAVLQVGTALEGTCGYFLESLAVEQTYRSESALVE